MTAAEFADFERAVWRAWADLFITTEEAHAAIDSARAEVRQ